MWRQMSRGRGLPSGLVGHHHQDLLRHLGDALDDPPDQWLARRGLHRFVPPQATAQAPGQDDSGSPAYRRQSKTVMASVPPSPIGPPKTKDGRRRSNPAWPPAGLRPLMERVLPRGRSEGLRGAGPRGDYGVTGALPAVPQGFTRAFHRRFRRSCPTYRKTSLPPPARVLSGHTGTGRRGILLGAAPPSRHSQGCPAIL